MFPLLNPILNSPKFPFQTASKISPQNRPSPPNSTVSSNRRCVLYDLHKELVPYAAAWSWQNAIVNGRKTLSKKDEDFADSVIVLQHHPVYTLGAGSSQEFLNFDAETAPFDLYRTERGGEVTYHGPGQLVMYPIINLRYYNMDLHWYLRALEEVIMLSLSSGFGIEASQIEGLTGVWVGNQKLAAIGIRVSQWITYHGLALNVTTDMAPFRHIVPCGIRDRQVGSIKGLLKENFLSKGSGEDTFHMDDCQLLDIAHNSLITAFCEVFQVDLQHHPLQTRDWRNSGLTAPTSQH